MPASLLDQFFKIEPDNQLIVRLWRTKKKTVNSTNAEKQATSDKSLISIKTVLRLDCSYYMQ